MARTIDGSKFGNKGYDILGISFTLAGPAEDGLIMLRAATSCRDFISDMMIAVLNTGRDQGREKNIDFSKLHLLVSTGKGNSPSSSFQQKLQYALNVINAYERLGRWDEFTTLEPVKLTNSSVNSAWLFEGSGRWMKTSHLVSMLTLIIRVVINYGGFENVYSVTDAEKRFKEISNTAPGGDGQYLLPPCYKKFKMLAKWYDEIFAVTDSKFWMPADKIGRWHSSGGIHSLCTNAVYVPGVDEFMERKWNEWQACQHRTFFILRKKRRQAFSYKIKNRRSKRKIWSWGSLARRVVKALS
jgi:hypothetical protein